LDISAATTYDTLQAKPSSVAVQFCAFERLGFTVELANE